MVSKKIGEPVKKTLIRFSKLLEFKLIPKKIAPKNKLPESPINIFEGFQLKNKNKINPPTNAHKTEGNERKIIEERYSDMLKIDFSKKESNKNFWFISKC